VTAGARNPLEGGAPFRHPLAPAVLAVLHERGYNEATVEEFIARAGIEPAEFDASFRDKPDVVLRVFEAFIDDFVAQVKRAFESVSGWPDNLRAAAYETTRWINEYPDAAWWGMVGVLDAPEMARVRREEVFRWCASLIDEGRAQAEDPAAVPRAAPLIAIGAIVEILTRHQQGTIDDDPVATVPKLMYGAVRPYLGEEAARRELEIPPPPDLVNPNT
jgi:AcrR family transcriptional regulator